MTHRRSNLQRNRWAVDLLDIQPTDRVLELGCGPGVAMTRLLDRACRGLVVGLDHSDVMIRVAQRRNEAAAREGRLRLVHDSIEQVSRVKGPFDAALAVNTVGFWPEPSERVREIAGLLRSGGRIALVAQPRCPGATSQTSAAAAEELACLLDQAGFVDIRREMLQLDPPAVCVLGVRT
jgi:SAM-dependent methyltransferase